MGNGVIEVLRHTPYIIVFAVGAAGTFFTNILRIVTIYVLAANYGQSQALLFHNYLGELFFIAWILLYLTIIAFGTFILKKLRRDKKKAAPQTT